jgi:hypothetical protein
LIGGHGTVGSSYVQEQTMTAMNGTGWCVRDAGIAESLAWKYDTDHTICIIYLALKYYEVPYSD